VSLPNRDPECSDRRELSRSPGTPFGQSGLALSVGAFPIDNFPSVGLSCQQKNHKSIGKIVTETRGSVKMQEIIISADSHVMEPPDLWAKGVPAPFRDKAPRFPDLVEHGDSNPVFDIT